MVTKNSKKYERAKAVKEYKKSNPSKLEFKGFATGFNMAFNIMLKKCSLKDKKIIKLEGEVFGLGNAMENYKSENRKLKKCLKNSKVVGK